MSNELSIVKVDWLKYQSALQSIRESVFIEEQGVPTELEWDGQDEQAEHWLAVTEQDQAIATLRILSDGHIGRVAVLKAYRNQGVGTQLLSHIIDHYRNQQWRELFLYSQCDAQNFYSKLGFNCRGPEFMDAGIPHICMRLTLIDTPLLGTHHGKIAVAEKDRDDMIIKLIEQAQRRILILSNDLYPGALNQQSAADILSSLARKSRYSEIRMLAFNGKAIAQQNHQLLRLHQRLPTSIEMRKPAITLDECGEFFIVADRSGVLCDANSASHSCWADFNNKPTTDTYAELFYQIWHRSQIDREFSGISI